MTRKLLNPKTMCFQNALTRLHPEFPATFAADGTTETEVVRWTEHAVCVHHAHELKRRKHNLHFERVLHNSNVTALIKNFIQMYSTFQFLSKIFFFR